MKVHHIEKNVDSNLDKIHSQNNYSFHENSEQEFTPKLFSEEQNNLDDNELNNNKDSNETEQLFDQDSNDEEEFEIPAFLRRQNFNE